MTTYTWPATDSAFRLAQLTFKPRHNARFNTSELNGAGQGISLPGARWGLTVDFPKQTYAERARVEAFFNRLSGYEHRAQIWDLARTSPLLLSGAPLVNGVLAQFAQTLNLDGTISAGRNLLVSAQSVDSTVWTKSALTVTANATTAPDQSATADLIIPNTVAVNHSIDQNVSGFAAGTLITLSIYLKPAGAPCVIWRINAEGAFAGVTTDIRYDLSTLTTLAGQNGSPVARSVTDVGGGWYRLSISAVTNAAGGIRSVLFVSTTTTFASAGDGVSGIYAWGAQLEIGLQTNYTGLPSLIFGDWLSLPLTAGGSQLVQVVNTTVGETLTGVEFRPMLRAAVADNAAITIVQPSALYRLADPNALEFPRGGGGMCPPMSIELVEEFT
jgi:hypothetical protein